MPCKHCFWGTCNSDSRYKDRDHMKDVFFVTIPHVSKDPEKHKRWIHLCGRSFPDSQPDGTFKPTVNWTKFICSKHFVGGKGPTELNPEPLPAHLTADQAGIRSRRKLKPDAIPAILTEKCLAMLSEKSPAACASRKQSHAASQTSVSERDKRTKKRELLKSRKQSCSTKQKRKHRSTSSSVPSLVEHKVQDSHTESPSDLTMKPKKKSCSTKQKRKCRSSSSSALSLVAPVAPDSYEESPSDFTIKTEAVETEEHGQKCYLSITDDYIVKQWQTVGTLEKLTEDNDIAQFLLNFYFTSEHQSNEKPKPTIHCAFCQSSLVPIWSCRNCLKQFSFATTGNSQCCLDQRPQDLSAPGERSSVFHEVEVKKENFMWEEAEVFQKLADSAMATFSDSQKASPVQTNSDGDEWVLGNVKQEKELPAKQNTGMIPTADKTNANQLQSRAFNGVQVEASVDDKNTVQVVNTPKNFFFSRKNAVDNLIPVKIYRVSPSVCKVLLPSDVMTTVSSPVPNQVLLPSDVMTTVSSPVPNASSTILQHLDNSHALRQVTTVISKKVEANIQQNLQKRGQNQITHKAGLNSKIIKKIKSSRISCKMCFKGFYSHLSLHTHVLAKHKEHDLSCEKCRAFFSTMNSFHAHLRHYKKNSPYMCEYCGKIFCTTIEMTNHQNIHLGLKPCVCNDCGKSFARQTHLQSHMLTHTQVTKFICDQCGKAFAWAANMRNHRKCHEKQTVKPNS